MQALLTVEQLSEYLQKSVTSVRSDATRNPQSLPPVAAPLLPKRGRPTKAEQVTRSRRSAS